MKARLALALPCVFCVAFHARSVRAEPPPVHVQVVGEDERDFFSDQIEGDKADRREAVPEPNKCPPTLGVGTYAHGFGHESWNEWWDRAPAIADGDVLVFYTLGGYGGGLYQGVGFEGLFADWGGLRLAGYADYYEPYDGELGEHHDLFKTADDFDFFLGGRSVAPRSIAVGDIRRAFLHMEELSMTVHLGSRHAFDIYPSLGISHFGYYVRSDQTERGGAGYVHAGLGFNWIYKRFFAGLDLGWYPIEMFRYSVERTARGGELELVSRNVGDPFDARRFTISGHAGLSL